MQPEVWNEEGLRNNLGNKIIEQPGRYLFRGQNRIYPTVTPTLARLSGPVLGQAYTILRRFVGNYGGQIYPGALRGLLKAGSEEVIALLQHYGWFTPYLDLTDDLDTAFFFSHDGYAETFGPAIMFEVDTQSIGHNHVIVSHDQVVDPILNIRWSRQKGHAIRPEKWIDMDEVRSLDLRAQPYVKQYVFQPSRVRMAENCKKWQYYYESDLAIASQLKFIVEGIAQLYDLNPLRPELESFPH